MSKHGYSQTPTYFCWQQLRARCYDRNNPSYMRYGGRGITYDPRWDDFINFLTDMGEKPAGMSIDRIDNAGLYTKDNCRWATSAEQNSNYSQNVLLTHNGKTQTITAWATEMGVKRQTLFARYYRWGNDPARILAPVVSKGGWKR